MSVRVLDKEGFRAVISSLTDLSDSATVWALAPQSAIGDVDRAKVTLKLFHMSALGVDEHRRAFSPDGYPAGAYVTTELGNRHLVITIMVECYDADVEAAELVDQIRTRIRAESTTARLDALKLAFVWAEKTTMLPTVYDQRVVSVAAADFTFAGIAQWVSEDQGDWIGTVNGDNIVPGTLTG